MSSSNLEAGVHRVSNTLKDVNTTIMSMNTTNRNLSTSQDRLTKALILIGILQVVAMIYVNTW